MRLNDLAEKRTDVLHFPLELIEIPKDNCLRLSYDKEVEEDFARNIAKNGQKTPIIIRQEDGVVKLVCGSRRVRAIKIANEKYGAKITKVKCTIEEKKEDKGKMRELKEDERILLQLSENNHIQLSPLESGVAFKKLVDDYGYKSSQIAEEMGKSRTWVNDCLNLADAPEVLKRLVKEGKIKPTTAKKLRNADPQDRETATLKAELGGTVKGRDVDKAKEERKEKKKPFDAESFLSGLKLRGFKTYDEVGKEIAYSHKITIEQKDPAFITVAVLPI